MSAPTPPQLGPEEVAALVDAHPGWWPTGAEDRSGTDTEVTLLGRGESSTAWRARRGDAELAVRVPHRPPVELPTSLPDEHELLDRLPDGVGARPVAVHEPTAADPTAYLVTTLVPGHVLTPRDWTDGLLAALAGQLARLHVLARTDGLDLTGDHDLVEAATDSRDWWREHEPEHGAALEPLWPAVLAHQTRVQAAAPATGTTLIHGDACLTNVVVDGDVPRLIDWEWAGAGDPARDLAYAGGRVHADPWYADLDDDRVRRQVEAYAAARADLGSPADVEQLLLRRAGWLVHETYFVTPHLRRVASWGGPEAGRYTRTADLLTAGLSAWLT
ncbi:phosphotransferase family protein [Ornithinimicrobium cerasi]|uniref:phosphotransferase family protein n=1 Tax=Ornithinimicrobium cerasi TaxID=2248773 RepID=UPI00137B4979|nr:aminoglycoside phosphotransferase family protein [Ornithinimicrobium cerasi]